MKKQLISISVLILILLISVLILLIYSREKKDLLQLLKSNSERDQWKGTLFIIEGGNIGIYDDKQIVKHLIPVLSARKSWIRENAIHSLKTLGPSAEESVPFLISSLYDPDMKVQAAAILALGQIKSRLDLTIPALIGYASEDNENRWLVYRTLSVIGTDATDALPHIMSSLNHKDENVRIYAKDALKSIANTKEHPLFFTPLITTVCKKDAKDVKELLDSSSCNVNAADTGDKTALDWACMKGDNSIVKLLLEYGAKIDNADMNGNTPLLFATFSQNYDTIKLLLENGANINSVSQDGTTPLIWAAQKNEGYHKIIFLLLNNNAKVNLKDVSNKTALNYALMENNSEIINLLRKHGAKTAKELKASQNGGKKQRKAGGVDKK